MAYKKLEILNEGEEGRGIIVEWNTRRGCSGYISADIQDKELIGRILTEEAHKLGEDVKHHIFMNCILQKCDTENRNGRFYPRYLLERENNAYQPLIKEGRAGGAANHPDDSNIDVLNIAHRVIKSWWEGNTLLGVLEIMTSDAFHTTGAEYNSGDKIAGLLKKGYKLGISSRGVGSLKNIGGKNTVQDDFELICYDIVASPSTPGAFLYPDTEVKLNESTKIEKVENFSTSLIIKLDEFLKN